MRKIKDNYLHKSIYFYLGLGGFEYQYYQVAKYMFTFGNVPDGFCKFRSRKRDKEFLGRKVEDVEILVKRPDVLIIVAPEEIDEIKDYVPEKQFIDNYNKLFEMNHCMIQDKIFQTWGTDVLCTKFKQKAFLENIEFMYINQKNINTVDGILLWEVMGDHTPENYRQYMSQVNNEVQLYSYDFLYETPEWKCSTQWFLWDLEKIAVQKKKVILYGIKSHYTNVWLHILETFRVSFEIMDDKEIKNWYGYHIENIDEIAYAETEDLMVILNQPYEDILQEAELLKGYGISKENHNCVGLYEQIEKMTPHATVIDICAGPMTERLAEQDVPGYYTIGKGSEEDYKILTVGGSTSDSTIFQYYSWPEELYRILKALGIHVRIYSGGMSGAYSMQELSKVIRDTRVIKPDIIISYSGINDIGGCSLTKGYVNGVNGSCKSYLENPFENWLENEKMMKMAADKWNAKFYCFAQPRFYLDNKYSQYADFYPMGFYEASMDWKRMVKAVNGYPWFIDSTDILDDHPEVYFDSCHITTQGNRIIAEHIFNHIKNDIRQAAGGV